MYPHKYVTANQYRPMYRSPANPVTPSYSVYNNDDERFFWAPFVVGGLAGTALGYGIANNNQLNNGKPCCGVPIYPAPYPVPYPTPYQTSYQTAVPNTFSTYNTNTNTIYY